MLLCSFFNNGKAHHFQIEKSLAVISKKTRFFSFFVILLNGSILDTLPCYSLTFLLFLMSTLVLGFLLIIV